MKTKKTMKDYDFAGDWLVGKGVVTCEDEQWHNFALELLCDVSEACPQLLKFNTWYLYLMDEQTGEADNGADAQYWWLQSPAGSETVYVLGISVECLKEGRAYAILCILHELAHVLCGNEDHTTARFHSKLNDLIEIYNAFSGENIKNDYCGLQMRFDSIPYRLPENIPQQQKHRGSAFRTEAKR